MFYERGSYKDVDSRLESLKSTVGIYASVHTASRDEWEEFFEKFKELQEDFKTVRYPTKVERDNAWDTFFRLRNEAYELRQKEFVSRSEQHRKELSRMLGGLETDFVDGLIAGLDPDGQRNLRERMKGYGAELRDAMKHFNGIKFEMTKEDRSTVQEWISEIKYNHDGFWGEVNLVNAERREIREARQKEFEEKRDMAKQRIEENIEKNEEKLEKAKDALSRFEANRDNLEDRISGAYTDSHKEKLEGYLDETNDKISDIENQIERLDRWISEGKEKLDSFDN
jgi:DNA repair exonuclease SbcCD ATPase subunit